MKKIIGFCILLILLVAASGCTQSAKPATTPVPTTVEATVVPTTAVVTVPSTTVAATVVPTTAAAVKNVTTVATTAVTNVTVAATTVVTPKTVMTPSTKVTVIYIRNNTFVPQELTVLPGTGITWINDDQTVHSIRTLPQSPFKFVSGDIVPGATFGYTYTQDEGSYGFYDPGTNATGMIIIKKGESFVGNPTVKATATP
jgi:plastocyanin